jgi:hypothetical protein
VLLGLALFIAFRMAGCLLTYTPPKPLPSGDAGAAQSKRAIWNVPPEQPLPDNGYGVFEFDQSAVDSPLRITPRGEQGHIVLKVENSVGDRFVCWLFIRQGESAETRIPAGTYRLKLACGKTWYGEKDLFGPGGSYSAIVNEINVPKHTVYTVDLHPSTEGTLRERSLRAEEF